MEANKMFGASSTTFPYLLVSALMSSGVLRTEKGAGGVGSGELLEDELVFVRRHPKKRFTLFRPTISHCIQPLNCSWRTEATMIPSLVSRFNAVP